MKSNQERSNECLPPKKREIPACTLASDERPLTVAPAGESQRGGNLAWLASVASGQHASSAGEPFSPQYKPLTAPEPSLSLPSSSSIPSSLLPRAATTLPAIYTSPISHPGGALQYNPLPTNLHFISPAYGAPYASYISSPLASQRPHADPYASTANPAASKLNQHHPLGRPLPGLADGAPPPHSAQYVQLASGGPRTAHSPHGHLPLHMHPHHTLSLGASSPVLLQYPHDGPGAKKEEARPREVLNGELDKGRRFEPGSGKQGGTGKVPASTQHHQLHQHSAHQYEARHVVLPAEYGHDGASALRPSLVLVPNSHGPGAADPRGSPDKLPSSLAHSEKGSICMGKPMARPPSSSSGAPPPFPLPPACVESPKVAAPTLSPHTVIQTTPNATDALPLGLPSANFYSAQPPIIGYIAGAGQQAPLGYHASLPQHLLIPGTQPVIIPVSGAGAPALEGAVTSTSPPFPTALPHTFVTAAPKVEPFETPTAYANPAGGAVVQAQLHLPVVSAPAGVLTSPPPPPSAPSLPPYFAKGSIIQLADGELKRVEDLKTEDFIQSAEISSELKIDSSTVERIDGSHTPNFAIIQFAVGEHRSQVSVEVLVEYPFFVFGQGWSSCCPDRTTQLLELSCTKLSVGDVCISLTLKNLKNGSLKKSQGPPPEGPVLGPPPKPPKASSAGARGGGGHGERENGLGQRGSGQDGRGGGRANVENGEVRPGEREPGGAPGALGMEPGSRPAGRKRRWSAPEGRKVEKPDEEPPLTLPKPSFVPQEIKISIEGRSNVGK